MPAESLLLLSQPPVELSKDSISLAYRLPLVNAITKLRECSFVSVLLVAVQWPVLHGQHQKPRAQLYDKAQSILGLIYWLVSIVCKDIGVDVDLELPGSIDARIVFIDPTLSDNFIDTDSEENISCTGPIVPLQSLTKRDWKQIFSSEDGEARELLIHFRHLAHHKYLKFTDRTDSVKGRISSPSKDYPESPGPARLFSTHCTVAVGGTFDHLHSGHKLLLTATALLLQPPTCPLVIPKLIVGITGDELLKNKKYAEFLKSWKQRQEDVVEFLLSVIHFTRKARGDSVETISVDRSGPNGHIVQTTLDSNLFIIECIKIHDPFGPTITDESITALVVSGETRAGGQAVNKKRTENGLSALEIFEVDVIDLEKTNDFTKTSNNFASKISSTEIRKRKFEIAHRSLS